MRCNKETAEHYTWGMGCEGWRLVDLPDLSVIEERMPPGASEKLHYHERARQYFHLLAGEALFAVDGVPMNVRAGEGIFIAPGRQHHVKNIGAHDLRFILTSTPNTRGDRVDLEH